MASTAKSIATPAPRRKSTKGSLIVTLKLSPAALQAFAPTPALAKEETQSNEDAIESTALTSSPTPAAAAAAEPAAPVINAEQSSDSKQTTPAASTAGGIPSLMPPPTEGVKKKGKRGAAALGPDAPPKVRGKPGPKKKARLEDGSIDHSNTAPRAANGTSHKLGPKANQGAINAGLRALDRSGKPCRKWERGSFKLKSFTGVVWEISRWKAPPKTIIEIKTDEQSASGDSSKENKDSSQIESQKSDEKSTGVDTGSQNVPSPAPSNPSVPTQAPTPTPVLVNATS